MLACLPVPLLLPTLPLSLLLTLLPLLYLSPSLFLSSLVPGDVQLPSHFPLQPSFPVGLRLPGCAGYVRGGG